MSSSEDLRPLIQAALDGTDVVLDDVTSTPAGRRRVVRAVIDRALAGDGEVTMPTPPLTLDEIAESTRTIGAALDDSDALGERAYTLEVSSPGVGRPLRVPRHYRRNVGRLVTLWPDDDEPVTGRIVRAGTADLTIEVPAARTSPTRREDHAYAALGRAEVQVEFSRPDEKES